MSEQLEFLEDINNFLYSGGDVLWLILGVAIILWCLIIERLLFFKQLYPPNVLQAGINVKIKTLHMPYLFVKP
jgi:hypothetical protein